MNFEELFNLNNKVAIVTGGASGIGRATALRLAQAGADVVIADLNTDQSKKVVDEIESIGRRGHATACNILEDEDLVRLVDETLGVFGKINILINNAGGGGGGRENPFKIDVADFKRDFDLNVFSAWRLIQLCVPI